jgi:hypothetical protein
MGVDAEQQILTLPADTHGDRFLGNFDDSP